jgi:hypothetical protein
MQAGYGLQQKSERKCVRRRCRAVVSLFNPGRRSLSIFVEKFVVEDGRCQLVRVLGMVSRLFGTNQPALAKYVAVLLSGDFFGHLEDQFHERIRRQLLWTLKQYARLADVLDQALVPGTEILPAISNRKLRSQPPSPGHPGRLLFTGAAADGGVSAIGSSTRFPRRMVFQSYW